jgi:hypothetical protein
MNIRLESIGKRLRNGIPFLELPVDQSRPVPPPDRQRLCRTGLSRERTDRLFRMEPASGRGR